MAAAIIPLIEIGIQELPSLVALGMEVVNGLKHIFHKDPGTKFAPEQVTQVQAMALAGMKAKLSTVAPAQAITVSDGQLQQFIEMLYQVSKIPAVTATALSTNPVTVPLGLAITNSPAMQVVQAFSSLLPLFQTVLVEIQQIKASQLQ